MIDIPLKFNFKHEKIEDLIYTCEFQNLFDNNSDVVLRFYTVSWIDYDHKIHTVSYTEDDVKNNLDSQVWLVVSKLK